MAYVQFTAEVKFAEIGNDRSVRFIRAQNLAKKLYELLDLNSNINMPLPAGAQRNMSPSFRYVPQFGNTPARFILTGIHVITGELPNPFADATIMAHSDYYTGYLATVQKEAVGNLQATFTAKVKLLTTILESVIATLNGDTDAGASLYRLDYAGIAFGGLARGYHFPRN